MARFLGGAALVLLGAAAVDAAVSSTVRMMARGRSGEKDEPHFPAMRSAFLDASQALQSAVVLRAHPLSGERLRAAERTLELALADERHAGDAARDADVRLLLALLAARDGRFDEALYRYAVAARAHPSDPRPKALAFLLCGLTGQPDEVSRPFERRARLLGKDAVEQLRPLLNELVVAAALGGAAYAIVEDEAGAMPTQAVMLAAAERVDAWIAAALRDGKVSVGKRMQVWALRAFFHAKMSVVRAKYERARREKSKEGEEEGEDEAAA